MPSANDFTTRALRLLGIFEATETPPAEDLAHGLIVLNDWIDSLALERLTIYTVTRTLKSLGNGTASYTVGSGGDINIARPITFAGVSVIADDTASPTTETPLPLPIHVSQYQAIPNKTTSGTPDRVYWDAGWSSSRGTLYVYPVPAVSTMDLVLYTPTALTQFADGTTSYTFPPGYARMIRTNLALELAGDFNVVPSPDVTRVAVDSKARIKAANLKLAPLGIDPLLIRHGGRRYNIYSDSA